MFNSATSYGMVEKQLKPRGIKDSLVLAAMSQVPRDKFLDQALSSKAYHDCSLPIGGKQTMSKPFIVAFMLQNLELKGNERILDVGTGSGYQAAVLSRICKQIFSVERIFGLAARAKKLFDQMQYCNISVKVGDGSYGWKEYAPYDAVIAAASATSVPIRLVDQLASGGKMIIPLKESEKSQKLYLFEKTRWRISKKILADCSFVDFVNS